MSSLSLYQINETKNNFFMKKSLFYVAALLVCGFLASCQKEVSLQPTPAATTNTPPKTFNPQALAKVKVYSGIYHEVPTTSIWWCDPSQIICCVVVTGTRIDRSSSAFEIVPEQGDTTVHITKYIGEDRVECYYSGLSGEITSEGTYFTPQ